MEQEKLYEQVDNIRWLMNSGLSNDLIKDNLFMYGYILHKDVEIVDIDVDFEKKTVYYHIYIGNKKTIEDYNNYYIYKSKYDSKTIGIIDIFRFKRLLKKYTVTNLEFGKSLTIDFKNILSRFVKDYCGSKWVSTLEVKHSKDYVEDENGLRKENISVNTGYN